VRIHPAAARVLAATVGVLALASCGTATPQSGRWAGGASPSATGAQATTGVPNPKPAQTKATPAAKPKPKPTPSPTEPPHTLDWYLSQLPTFGPAPAAHPVDLSHDPGEAPWVHRIPTDQRVAFLTIDDGWIKRPEALPLMRAAKVPVTLFLTVNAIKTNPGYFEALQPNGARIEAHTLTHRKLTDLRYLDQKQEICGSAGWLGAEYGRRPTLFRPPFGEKNDDTLRAAADCGMKACFFWTETVDKGIVRYQSSDHRIKPGDIILMHFRDAFADDFLAALKAIKASGLTPALLENYVP
jgi:peptidoglycan/xylan/chitin deacetylase (PgdA/CDA1 family)